MGIARQVFSIGIVAASFAAFAAPADLDGTFGTNGVQLLDFGGPAPVRVVASVRQYSGKVVVVGQSRDPATNRNRLAFGRLNADGTPDATFGTGGWALLDDGGDLAPVAMVLTAGDALRVVGKRDGQRTFIARMDADGLSSADNGVMVDYNIESLDETPRAMASLASSQLAVAGTCTQYPSGTPVACVVTYHQYGYRSYGPILLGGASSSSDALAITADECASAGFYAAGRAADAMGNRDMFIAKVNGDLQVDATFGNRTVDFGGQDEAYGVALRGCGHVMVAGRSESGGIGQVAMASMSAFDGTLDITDNTFGTGGKVLLPIYWQGIPADAGVSSLNFSWGPTFPDGIFTLITVRPNAGESHLVAARFARNGSLAWMQPLNGPSDNDVAVGVHDINQFRDSVIALGARNGVELVASKYDVYSGMEDPGYGLNGVKHVQLYVPTQDQVIKLVASPLGYVGLVSITTGNGGSLAIFRATGDGGLDYSFGGGAGLVTVGNVERIAAQPDGKVLATHNEWSNPNDINSPIVAVIERLDAAGNYDPAFGSGGRAVLQFGTVASQVEDIAFQPDGKMVVLVKASYAAGTPQRMAVTRLNADGTPDPTFAASVINPGAPYAEQAQSVAVLGDGRIMVGGQSMITPNNGWVVYRLLPSGAIDASWNGGGAGAMTPGCQPYPGFSQLAAGPGGTVVVSGGVNNPQQGGTDSCFVRFTVNGALDASFGAGGMATPNLGLPLDYGGGIAVDSYGRVAATIKNSGSPTPALIRLNADGSFDTSFGGSGVAVIPNMSNADFGGVLQQADGRLLVWGTGSFFGDGDALLARFQGGGVPTQDTTPDPFAFANVTGVPLSTMITSNAVTITGISAPTPISVANGGMSIGCGSTFDSNPAMIVNGQTVCVRHFSAATAGTSVTTTLTVGGVSATFVSTTAMPLDTTITGMPPNPSTSAGATFTFTSSDPAATIRFECALDGSPWGGCTSPRIYSVPQGSHTFQVRAVSSVGPDPTPASYTWQVNLTPPDTTITSGPSDPAPIASTSATFTFTSNEAGATFECSLDGAGFSACTSPVTYSGLAEGRHTFAVRATDAAGTIDPSPALAAFTVDLTAPQTSIASAPSAMTSSLNASFTFSSDDGAARFECALDGGAYAACTSPATYASLAEGLHSFQVRAIDAAGNADASPASHQWTVDATAPDTVVTSGPALATSATTATFTFQSEASATFECGLDTAVFTPCANPVTFSGLAEGTHRLTVRAVDAAGNVDATPSVFTWTIDVTAPNFIGIGYDVQSPTSATSFTATFFSEPDATFVCRLDGAPFATCPSSVTYTGLADGSHTLDARPRDAAGNLGPIGSVTWVVDTVAPDTTITGGPTGVVASTQATFTLGATETLVPIDCRLDGAPFASCGNPVTFTGLADGSHTFEARARDFAGNVDATPASRTWTVDTTAPDTAITSGPSGTVASSSASIAFSSEPGASFECRLDGAAFAACSSPASLTGLAQGSHTFEVRARDAVGNVDATPAARTWAVDTLAPDTTIVSGPSGAVSSTSATFTFSASEPATFQCRIDGSAYTACLPDGITYLGGAQGSHTFEVRAIDAVGNADPTPASRTWIIDTIAPDTSITGGPAGNNNPDTATFTFASTEPGSTFQCSLDAAAFSTCASGIVYAGLAKGEHTFQVQAIDAAGNVDATAASRTWRVNK